MGTIIRGTVAYWVLLFVLRLLGRRAVSQLSPFEFIVMFLLGGMSIQSIVSDDRSIFTAIIGILTIAVNHVAVSALKQRFVTFRKLVDGTPIVVAENGKIDRRLLHGLRMLEEDLQAVARQQGMKSLEKVRLAVVERDGNVALFKRE
jgi:uncharacterized membrane protein YcaP (DUF421 family)